MLFNLGILLTKGLVLKGELQEKRNETQNLIKTATYPYILSLVPSVLSFGW